MGRIWASGDAELSLVNLNSPIVFDARVNASLGAASGASYPTVQAALDAGRKSIWVDPGTYAAGFTVGTNNTLIECAVPAGYDGSAPACKFGGQIIVSASAVEIRRAAVVGSTGYGFRVDTGQSGARLVDCRAYQSALTGFYLHYPGTVSAGSIDNECRGCFAIDCGGSLYDGFYIGDVDLDMDWLLDGCLATASGRDGFMVCHNAIAVATVSRIAKLINCTAYSNATHGLRVGGRVAVQVTGGNYRSNGGAGIYMATQETSAARSSIIGARLRSNVGAGLQLQAVSTSQIGIGIQAYSNGTNFINCGSMIGFSTCNNGV